MMSFGLDNIYVLPGLTVAWYIYLYLRKRSAPSLSNVRGPAPVNFLVGNIPQLISAEGYDFHFDLAQNYGSVVKLNAILGAKQLYVFDHAAMQSVLVKEEHIWNMPDPFLAANHLMFGPCLVSTSGKRHKRGRKVMNPVFSPSRLREMLPMLYKIAHKMSDDVLATAERNNGEIDVLKILGTTALEFIGQAGLGHSFAASGGKTLEGMKQLLFLAKSMIIPMQALPYLMTITPPGLRRYLLDITPSSGLHQARDLVDIMDKNSQNILKGKREAIAHGDSAVLEQIGQGKDLMSLLLKANEKEKVEDRLPDEELLGQMNVFIFAGTDTTSTAMSRALQELAMHPDIQNRLREEVTKASIDGDIAYEDLLALPILEAVSRETLRMYPPAVTASRQNSQDVMMPLTTPMMGVDGKIITELFIPRGTTVHLGLKAANQNRDVWGPDALEWKPERWLAPLPQTVVNAQIPGVYTNLMTFIGGPRGCIGFKFAEMSMKILLSVLLKRFVFTLSDKKVEWKVGVAEAPTVNGDHMLPLIVTPISDSD